MAEKHSKGTEALDGAPKSKESKGGGSTKKAGSGKPKRKLHRITSTMLDDGSIHHVHDFKSGDGSPDYGHSEEYSSASPDDAGAHVAENFGGDGGGDGEGEEEEAAAAPQGGAATGAPAGE